ncbi:MAG: GAF domain-containing protein [Bacteroidota bacterium]|nr:GAF domain-containing protein [Bacteroidota bacterium]
MEEINVVAATKQEQYEQLIPQIISLIADESNSIANMANIVAALKQRFTYYSWAGFYLWDSKKSELVLGPFQGKIACTRIAIGKGVCGTAAHEKKTIVVSNVNEFRGHIFCDGDSKSEIVVPIIGDTKLFGVLDVDSHSYNSFDDTDKKYLEQLITLTQKKILLYL